MPAPSPSATYLDAAVAVDQWLAGIRQTGILALDTEGASFHRYVDRIYLIQLSTRERHAIIDPLPIGVELVTPEWSHLNFLVSSPLVNSADPRDRRMEYRYRDLVALALMASQAFAGERPPSRRRLPTM